MNFYARVSTWWGPDSQWDYWAGNYYRDTHGPQYVSLDFEAFRFQLVRPLPTVDYISIGNYEYGISAWTVGNSSYPDRDKYKGLFLDGSSEVMNIKYNVGWFYPFPWIGNSASHGTYTARDNVMSGIFKIEPLSGLKLQSSAMLYSDFEVGNVDTNTRLTGEFRRLQNMAVDGNIAYNLKLGDTALNFDMKGGYSKLFRGYTVSGTNTNILSTGDKFAFPAVPPGTNDFDGIFAVGTLKIDNIFNTGIKLEGQGFYIKDYFSIMAARGDYANAAVQDVLDMFGNQSASAYPQDAAGFQKYENVPWESVAHGGWFGGTGIIESTFDLLKLHGEFSMWGYTMSNYNLLPEFVSYSNKQTFTIGTNVYTNNTNTHILDAGKVKIIDENSSEVRAYVYGQYKLDVGNGIDFTLSYFFSKARNHWPFAAGSFVRENLTGAYQFRNGYDFYSHQPMLKAYYQLTKVFRVGGGFQYRYDMLVDNYPNEGARGIYEVKGYTGLLDLQYSTPLGIIRSYIQGYISDNPRRLQYGQRFNDFRTPLIYYGNRYNVVALTELDINF